MPKFIRKQRQFSYFMKRVYKINSTEYMKNLLKDSRINIVIIFWGYSPKKWRKSL